MRSAEKNRYNRNRLGAFKNMSDEEFDRLFQQINTYGAIVMSSAEKVGLDLEDVGADRKNFFDADDLIEAARKDITGPAAMFIQELYSDEVQKALKLIEKDTLTVDDIRAITLTRNVGNSDLLAFQNNVISGVPELDQQRIAPLLDNFVNTELFKDIIADGVVTAEEAKRLLGGPGDDITVPDLNDPTKSITMDSYQKGALDVQVIDMLRLNTESNDLVRAELVKFLRTLDKDGLLPKNL